MPERNDFRLGDWTFPQNDLIAIESQTVHMDEGVWSTGSASDPHPLNEFWPDRFLIDPNVPGSGPLKRTKVERIRTSVPEIPERPKEKPIYSVDGLTGAWIPYGGGQTLCPGRHYAKQEMLMTFAILATAFDIEIKHKKGVQTNANMRYFGLGVLPPKGKTPFRIRRRRRAL
jgi:cytochrome P450